MIDGWEEVEKFMQEKKELVAIIEAVEQQEEEVESEAKQHKHHEPRWHT